MKMALIVIAAVLAVLAAAVVIAGLLLPRTSEASRSVLLPDSFPWNAC